MDQGCCLGDVAGERCCWKQESDAGASLFDCGRVSCSPFLSLDFIVVVVSESSSFVCRALLLSRLRRLYRLSLDRQVPLVSSRHIRRTLSCPFASSHSRLDVAYCNHFRNIYSSLLLKSLSLPLKQGHIQDHVFSSRSSQPKPFPRPCWQC